MERFLGRPCVNVCSNCFNNFVRAFSSNSIPWTFPTSFKANDGRTFQQNKSVALSHPSRLFVTTSLRKQMLSSPQNLDMILNKWNIPYNDPLIRKFATGGPDPSKLPKSLKEVKSSRKSPITWKTILIVAGFGGLLLLGMKSVKWEKEQIREKNKYKTYGKALLGGDWTLTDHHGNVRSSKDFRGQWLLIYFGFTNCPDVCPEEMEKIVTVINKMDVDPDLPKIQPIMITVDPQRDTPEALKEYCAEFSPRLLGFSGTEEQIETATRAYRVYYSAGPKDEDNDYIVDHSIISYLVNPDGEFAEYFGQNKKADEVYQSAKSHISSYLKKTGGRKQ